MTPEGLHISSYRKVLLSPVNSKVQLAQHLRHHLAVMNCDHGTNVTAHKVSYDQAINLQMGQKLQAC